MRDEDEGDDLDPDDRHETPRVRSRSDDRAGERRTSPLELEFKRDITDSLEHWTRDWDDRDRAVFNQLSRNPDDPVPFGMLVRERNSWIKYAESQDAQINKLDERTRRLVAREAKRIRWARNLLWSSIGTIAVAIGVLAGAIWNRSAMETEQRLRLEQVRSDTAELKSQFQHAIEIRDSEIETIRQQLYRRAPSSQLDLGKRASALVSKGLEP